jgi:osmotically-inducible protein OsmY
MNKHTLLILGLVALTPALHGCFPAVVAGAGGAVLVAEDRRSSGAIIDDSTIEHKVSSRVSDKYGDRVHLDVTSYNRFVLLAGEVPTQEIKDDIGVIALGVENARNVQNELQVAPNTSTSTHANDAYLTSKVKTRFASENKFQVNHVKVVTENGIVYLLGLVKHKEGQDAAEIASTTSGVQKVVKVFEYID